MTAPLLEARQITKHFAMRRRSPNGRSGNVRAVDGVSLIIMPGETLGLVGESGCGKSTLARTLLFLEQPTSGEILFDGQPIGPDDAMRLRRRAQIVFQDPYSSLPPRMKVGRILAEPYLIHRICDRAEIPDRVSRLLVDVGLKPDTARSLPHELSGGQRQRVNIARALAVEPDLIIADEAVSSLDVSVQAQILNLLRSLQDSRGLAYLFISHDLGVVKYMSHRIAVMYLGKVVETAARVQLHQRPLHPYTRILLSSVPTVKARRTRPVGLGGEPPSPSKPPPGCTFHPRCPMADGVCVEREPELAEWEPSRWSACHFASHVPERMPAWSAGGTS